MEYSRKAKNINPSITLAITAKAKALKAEGVDVVSFGAGEPDFNTPKNIIDAAIRAMEEGKTKYTPTAGIIELREAICNKLEKDNNLKYNPNQIIVSTGAKQCLADVFMAILNPGDEVIVPTPYWVSYPELIKLADGTPVFVEANEKAGYKYTIEDLEKVVTDKTKALVLNSPNNPTGTIYQKEELEVIAEFAKKHDILIISDEMYEKLIYDGEKHISIASLSQDAYERTVVINGVSKAYAMTGWRLGYACAPKVIMDQMVKIHQFAIMCAPTTSQYAAVEALRNGDDDVARMKESYNQRRNYLVHELRDMGLDCFEPYGAFYVFPSIKKFGLTSEEFATRLLEEEKVAVVPGTAFGDCGEGFLRISYAYSLDDLKLALGRVRKFVERLEQK
jgi:aspartate/methionine/tyrosine aminotransferase